MNRNVEEIKRLFGVQAAALPFLSQVAVLVVPKTVGQMTDMLEPGIADGCGGTGENTCKGSEEDVGVAVQTLEGEHGLVPF